MIYCAIIHFTEDNPCHPCLRRKGNESTAENTDKDKKKRVVKIGITHHFLGFYNSQLFEWLLMVTLDTINDVSHCNL